MKKLTQMERVGMEHRLVQEFVDVINSKNLDATEIPLILDSLCSTIAMIGSQMAELDGPESCAAFANVAGESIRARLVFSAEKDKEESAQPVH